MDYTNYMTPIAFMTTLSGRSIFASKDFHNPLLRHTKSPVRSPPISKACRRQLRACTPTPRNEDQVSRPHIALIAKRGPISKEVTIDVDELRKGIFGMRANAYWDSIGVIPLVLAGFGITALAIKMVKLKSGQLRGGAAAVNKMIVPKTAITSEEEEAELHAFKCGGCGYEMYPARGREFKFFPDSFKCPLCGTPKSDFWDLNDPDDPRNQTDDEDEDDDNNSNSPEPEPVSPTPGTAVQIKAEDPVEPVRSDNSDSRSSA